MSSQPSAANTSLCALPAFCALFLLAGCHGKATQTPSPASLAPPTSGGMTYHPSPAGGSPRGKGAPRPAPDPTQPGAADSTGSTYNYLLPPPPRPAAESDVLSAKTDVSDARTTTIGLPGEVISTQSRAAPHAAPGQPADVATVMHDWFPKLPFSKADYYVPPQMVLGDLYTGTVTIHPLSTASAPGTTGHPLRVSTFMRVDATQPANAGFFELKPEHGDCKFVSQDADTQWQFSIKPLHYGTNKSVTFTAYVLYGEDDATCASTNLKVIALPSDTESVSVKAISAKQTWQEAVETFLKDPVKWFKYILPGGAGFGALGKLVAWYRKRRKPQPSPPAAPVPAGGTSGA